MSGFSLRLRTTLFPRFTSPISSRLHVKKLILLVAASLWIPWTLACGASAQSSPATGSTTPAQRTALELTSQLPAATSQQPYAVALAPKGGTAPYKFSITLGALPVGLSLNSSLGVVYGTPQLAGSYLFRVLVTDSAQNSGSTNYTLLVAPALGGGHGVNISIAPTTVTLSASAAQKFVAQLQGTSNTAVRWAASDGSIAQDGTFTAPAVTERSSVTVLATSAADPTKTASASVTVEPVTSSQPLTIQTSSLPDAESGQSYQQSLSASGGKTPYSWSASGSLPAGLTLNSSGTLSGTASTAGTFTVGVKVADAASHTATANFALTVSSTSGSGTFDGPAELPRVYLQSTMADTPAPGKTIPVNAGGDLRGAITSANCGDTIELQAGAEFDVNMNLPAKPCDDQHWIIIRTSAPDSSLPPEGQRLTPCYAGVASLPNRPAFNCPAVRNVLARVVVTQGGTSGPIVFLDGANHYRLIGLEITRPPKIGPITALVSPAQNAVVDHVILDRCWIHGTATDDTRRGFDMIGMSYVGVIDSYLNDFHCTAISGACVDSQAVGSGGGHTPNGPYKVVDDFLEAAGENILFAGMAEEYPSADIEIRQNHFFKPLQWQAGTPGFVGGPNGHPFIVKNHIEFKNGVRALLEGNVFENNWGGFSQTGYSVIITPRNNYDAILKKITCNNCQVTDITVRYSTITHVTGGFLIFTALTQNQPAAAGGRISVHDVVLDDLNGGGFGGVGNGWPKNVLNSISIAHVTAFADPNHPMISIGNSRDNPEMWGFNFSDNIMIATRFPVWSVGYPNDCSAKDVPVETMSACFKTSQFTNNVLIGTTPAFSSAKWPTGNFFPTDISSVGFVGYKPGGGGNYALSPSSPYHLKASDGTDPGADITALQQAIAGVQ